MENENNFYWTALFSFQCSIFNYKLHLTLGIWLTNDGHFYFRQQSNLKYQKFAKPTMRAWRYSPMVSMIPSCKTHNESMNTHRWCQWYPLQWEHEYSPMVSMIPSSNNISSLYSCWVASSCDSLWSTEDRRWRNSELNISRTDGPIVHMQI